MSPCNLAAILLLHCSLMDTLHTTEQAEMYAESALALMLKHGIPPHPINFTIWYCYSSREVPDLNKALDALVANGGQLDEERNAAIYRKFCGLPFEALPAHLIAERIETELAVVLSALQQAGRSAHEYGRTLRSAAGEVTSDDRKPEVYRILGQLMAQTRAMALQSRELEKQLLASSAEIGNLKLELEGARREAQTDALTGLANRKMFEHVLSKAIAEAEGRGTPLSLLMLDIDHFKKFNDDFGHVVGDNVLKLLALVLRENVKGQDTACRYGGEEFVVVLPRTRGCDACKLADTIRRNIAGKKLFNRKTGQELGTISVSIGAAEYTFPEPAACFIERADQALYAAKWSGRNRVVAAEDIRGTIVPQPRSKALAEPG